MLNRLLFTLLAPLSLAAIVFPGAASQTNLKQDLSSNHYACTALAELTTCTTTKALLQGQGHLSPQDLEALGAFIFTQLSNGWSVQRLVAFVEDHSLSAEDIARKALTLSRETLPSEQLAEPATVEIDPSRPFIHPAPQTEQVTSGYGWRRRPISGASQFHYGIDYGAPLGSEVLAVADGVVTEVITGCPDFTSYNCGSQYGNRIEIDHGEGKVTLYAHLQWNSITVQKGDKVTRGQAIAKVGSSGWSTGAHLDFRLMVNGNFQDPTPLVAELPVTQTVAQQPKTPQ